MAGSFVGFDLFDRSDITDPRKDGKPDLYVGNNSPASHKQRKEELMSKYKTIHKFVVPFGEGEQQLSLPEGGKVLSVQMQHGKPTMWVLCDPKARMETRWFIWYATGQTFEDQQVAKHIVTMQFPNETMPIVFHLFDVTGDAGGLL